MDMNYIQILTHDKKMLRLYQSGKQLESSSWGKTLSGTSSLQLEYGWNERGTLHGESYP